MKSKSSSVSRSIERLRLSIFRPALINKAGNVITTKGSKDVYLITLTDKGESLTFIF